MPLQGTFNADFSAFETAVDRSVTKLVSFETGATKVERSLNRMVDSFSGRKLIQEATLAAEAVERMGGASRLTEAELARVGAQAAEAAAKLRALGQEVPAGIQKLADTTKVVAETTKVATGYWQDLGTQVAATAAGFVSAQAIIGGVKTAFRDLSEFVGDSIQSYASAEAAAKKMTVALQAQGTATPAVIGQFNDLAGSFQQTTAYSDDLINEMEALLTQVGNVAPGEMKKALQASTDLASGLGIDLESATRLVAKAFEGQTQALKRYGIVVSDAAVQSRGIDAVLESIQQRFGGQAAAEIETYAGRVKQLGNDWDNVKEQVGGAIANNELLKAVLREIDANARGAAEGTGIFTLAWKAFATAPISGDLVKLEQDLSQIAEAENAVADGAARMNTIPPPKIFDHGVEFFRDLDVEAKKFGDETIDAWKRIDAQGAELFDAETRRIEDRSRKWIEGNALISQSMRDLFLLQAAQGGTAQDQERAAIKADTQTRIEALGKLGLEQDTYNNKVTLLLEEEDKRLKGIGVDWGLVGTSSARAAEQAIEGAQKTLDAMIAAGASNEAITEQIAKILDLTKQYERFGTVAAAAHDLARGHADQHTAALERQLNIVEKALAAEGQSMAGSSLSGNLDDKNKTVRTLSGEYITPKEAYERFHTGGSFDASSPEGAKAILGSPQQSIEDFVRMYAGYKGGYDFAAQQYQVSQIMRQVAQQTLGIGGGGSPVTVNVSGVWDSRSKDELKNVVSEAVMAAISPRRPLPGRG